MINLICESAWNITTDIFSIIGVLLTIFLSIIFPIYNYNKNRLTTKSFNASFNAVLAPKIRAIEDKNAIVFSCFVLCTNKTNKDVSIIKAEIANKEKVVDLFYGNTISSFTVKAKSTYSYPFRLVILPNIFQLSADIKLRLYTTDKVLEYDIAFPNDRECI